MHLEDDVPVWKVLAVVIGIFIMCGLVGLCMVLFLPRPSWAAWDRVAGEWEPYRLNESQMNWFRSVRNKQGVRCCDISDGHPTEMQRREDGIYIPDPLHKDGPWLLVPKEAMIVQGTNPVGVATVWYVIQNTQDDRYIHIRCFVPEAET